MFFAIRLLSLTISQSSIGEGWLREEAEVGGGEGDGGGEEAGEGHEDAAATRAADAEQAADVAVERAVADDADVAAEHVGGYFIGGEVFDPFGLPDGCYESLHVGGAHGQRLAGLAASDKAVLERGGVEHDGVEFAARGAYEEQVGHAGHVLTHSPGTVCDDFCFQGGEHLEASFRELAPGGELGVAAFEVAHCKPLFRGFHCSV